MIKLLLKIPSFRKKLVAAAFKIAYVDSDEFAKLTYVLSDSNGVKYYKYVRPELMPYQRYEHMQTRLLEIESKISRETLSLFSQALQKAAKKNDLLTVARLAGELEERLTMLYDPELFVKFLCGMLIREDQIKSASSWNQTIETEKWQQLMKDNEGGKLSFFFQELNLTDHVRFSDTLDSDLKILEEKIVQNQLKEVRAFDQMLKKVLHILNQKSSNSLKNEISI